MANPDSWSCSFRARRLFGEGQLLLIVVPLHHLATPQGCVTEVGRTRGGHADPDRGIGLVPTADAFQPVTQVVRRSLVLGFDVDLGLRPPAPLGPAEVRPAPAAILFVESERGPADFQGRLRAAEDDA